MASRISVLVCPAICANKVRYSHVLFNLSLIICICDIFQVENVKIFGIKSEIG